MQEAEQIILFKYVIRQYGLWCWERYVEDLSETSAIHCEVQILALCSILFYLILSNPVMTLNLDRGWFPSWRDETP